MDISDQKIKIASVKLETFKTFEGQATSASARPDSCWAL